MYDWKCDVDIRLLGCALVLLVMALLTIHREYPIFQVWNGIH